VKAVAALAASSLALFALACNEGPANDALAIADQEIAAARPELERYAPGELATLEAAVRQARAQVGVGHYTEALKEAQGIPARVRTALAAAAAGKDKEAEVWKGLAESLPRLQETIATRIAWLTEAQRLPRGMDEAGLAAAPAELDSLKQAWTKASAAFQGGDVATAVRTGREVEGKSEILAARLGLVFATPPPPGAPAASSAAPATPSPKPSSKPTPTPTPPPTATSGEGSGSPSDPS
jgi:hypothetical protein